MDRVGYVGMDDQEWFDWVKVRALCSSEHLFGELKDVVRGDVESANKNVSDFEFSIERSSNVAFTVVRRREGRDEPLDAIRFSRTGSLIEVLGRDSRPIVKAQAALVGDGRECLVEVDGQSRPMRLWRFSRLVLEDLFFPNG